MRCANSKRNLVTVLVGFLEDACYVVLEVWWRAFDPVPRMNFGSEYVTCVGR